MHRPSVLIVDDDLAIIKFVRANLEASDYKTFTAMDGAEALQSIEMELPDLVILDANPLKDIRNTQSIWRVVKGGSLFDPDMLAPAPEQGSTD